MDKISQLFLKLQNPTNIPQKKSTSLYPNQNKLNEMINKAKSNKPRRRDYALKILDEVDIILNAYFKYLSRNCEEYGIQRFESEKLLEYAIIYNFSIKRLPPDIQHLFELIFDFYESFNDIDNLERKIVDKAHHEILLHFFSISNNYLDQSKNWYLKLWDNFSKKPVNIPTIESLVDKKIDQLFEDFYLSNKDKFSNKDLISQFEDKILIPELESFFVVLEHELRKIEKKFRSNQNSKYHFLIIESPLIYGKETPNFLTASLGNSNYIPESLKELLDTPDESLDIPDKKLDPPIDVISKRINELNKYKKKFDNQIPEPTGKRLYRIVNELKQKNTQ